MKTLLGRDAYDWLGMALLVGVLAVVCSFVGCDVAHASEFTSDNCIKALMGEAIGQSEAELFAHAHALRNRGTLVGVYGLNNWQKHNTPENWQRASRAWYTSEIERDTTNGCTHWLSDYDLIHSRPKLIAWRFKAVYSVKIGQTTFYRL